MKSSPQKQQKDISDLIEIFCLQMFLFFTSTILDVNIHLHFKYTV